MRIITNLMLLVLMLNITGTLISIPVVLFRKTECKTIFKLWVLRVCIIFYIIPLSYINYRYIMEENSFIFYSVTDKIGVVCIVLFIIWLIGIGVSVIKGVSYSSKKKKAHAHVIASDEVYDRIYEFRTDMGIKRRINVCVMNMNSSPFIQGAFKPTIYIPKGEVKNIDIILRHEIIHYKHRDNIWKPIFALVGKVFWFNPAVRFVVKKYEENSEFYCDETCCKYYDVKRYLNAVVDAAFTMTDFAEETSSAWIKNKSQLQKRVEHMRKTRKKIPAILLAILVAAGMSFDIVTVHAAEIGVRNIYDEAYFNTAEDVQLDVDETDDLEVTEGTVADFEGLEIIEFDNTVSSKIKSYSTLTWTVASGSLGKSSKIYKAKGSTLTLTVCVDPGDVNVTVGYATTDGKTYSVTSKDTFIKTFSITESGYIYIYLRNKSSKSVSAVITYK